MMSYAQGYHTKAGRDQAVKSLKEEGHKVLSIFELDTERYGHLYYVEWEEPTAILESTPKPVKPKRRITKRLSKSQSFLDDYA